MPNDERIDTDVVYLVVYVTDPANRNAHDVLAALTMLIGDGMRVELAPKVFNYPESGEDQVICLTGLGTNDGHIITGVNDARQGFGLTIIIDEGDETTEQFADVFIRMLDDDRISYGYFVLDEDYPFNVQTDLPNEVFKDGSAEGRTTCCISYKVIYADGRFEAVEEEEDPDEDDGEEDDPEEERQSADDEDDPEEGQHVSDDEDPDEAGEEVADEDSC